MKNLILGATLTVGFIASSHAFVPGGTDNMPWKASADVANNVSAHTSIVVTAATYTECAQQFQNAMDSHAYYHGDIFENIRYCTYKPFNYAVGGWVELELERELKELEEAHNIKDYTSKRDALIEEYNKSNPELPPAPRK